jgi:hypothetical protein
LPKSRQLSDDVLGELDEQSYLGRALRPERRGYLCRSGRRGAKYRRSIVGQVEDAGANQTKRKHPDNLAAYDYLLRGIELHQRQTLENLAAARRMLEKAIENDPELAIAYAWLSLVDRGNGNSPVLPSNSALLSGMPTELLNSTRTTLDATSYLAMCWWGHINSTKQTSITGER